MFLIDSHTHLFDSAFDNDRDTVVAACIAAGVEKMVLPCCNQQSISGIDSLCKKYPKHFFPTIGLHPEDIGENPDYQIETIFSAKFCKPIVAIGEIGIDLYWTKENVDIQQHIFDIQVAKAIELDLPIIIHCREAFPEVFEVLQQYRNKARGIFHCFGGDNQHALKILELGNFYFGIGGVITFKKSGATIAEIVKDTIPLDKIVLETDSPYLAPTPFRGKRNDSSLLVYIANKIAELKGIDTEQVATQTTKNSEKILGV